MIRNLLSLALLLAMLSFATGASAQSRSIGSMMGYGWGASSTTTGTGASQTTTGGQFVSPMWSLLSAQTGQTGTTSTGSSTANDFWAQMPMFQFLSQ